MITPAQAGDVPPTPFDDRGSRTSPRRRVPRRASWTPCVVSPGSTTSSGRRCSNTPRCRCRSSRRTAGSSPAMPPTAPTSGTTRPSSPGSTSPTPPARSTSPGRGRTSIVCRAVSSTTTPPRRSTSARTAARCGRGSTSRRSVATACVSPCSVRSRRWRSTERWARGCCASSSRTCTTRSAWSTATGRLLETSGRYRPIMGYPSEFWETRSIFDLLAPGEIDNVLALQAEVLAHPNEVVSGEFKVISAGRLGRDARGARGQPARRSGGGRDRAHLPQHHRAPSVDRGPPAEPRRRRRRGRAALAHAGHGEPRTPQPAPRGAGHQRVARTERSARGGAVARRHRQPPGARPHSRGRRPAHQLAARARLGVARDGNRSTCAVC
jgi:hypothetical protein